MKKLDISPEEILAHAFQRTKDAIFFQNFVPSRFHPRHSVFEPNADDDDARVHVRQIAIVEEHTTHATTELLDDRPSSRPIPPSNEAYSLEIRSDGTTIIKTIALPGVLHALTTLSLLFYAYSCGRGPNPPADAYTPYAPFHFKDRPCFPHQGLNLDIAHNRISPPTVRRTLDAMSLAKLNRLHLHATDAQYWSLEISALPALAREGGVR